MDNVIRYTVKITATVERVEKAGKRWERMTAADDSDYAYTPEYETTVQRNVDIYEQSMGSLDVLAVIMAANGATP